MSFGYTPFPSDEWRDFVEPYFGFLTENGFHVEFTESKWYATRVTYTSNSAAIAIVYSVEESQTEVQLIRLRDGTDLAEVFPGWPSLFITGTSPIDDFDLLWLLDVRAPEVAHEARQLNALTQNGLTESAVARQLAFYAAALHDHLADFLRGDFTVLDESERQLQAKTCCHAIPPLAHF